MLYIVILLLTAYFMFLLFVLTPAFSAVDADERREIDGISILVPFRNEEENLPRFLEALDQTDFGQIEVEYIFINDHSSDRSESIVHQSGKGRILRSPQEGKKYAIRTGVEQAGYPWVLTLDADVEVTQELASMLDALDTEKTKMFLFALSPLKRSGAVSAFFDLEFIALQAVGVGMAINTRPFLSNGACLLFEKEGFLKVDPFRKDYQIPTGDDIFGMLAIREKFGRHAIKVASAEPVIGVNFPKDMMALFAQRSRWISKTMDVNDNQYKVIAFAMALIHVIPLIGIVALFFGASWPDVLAVVFIKLVAEWIFFWMTTKTYRRRDLLPYLPLAQLFHPLYTLLLIISGLKARRRFSKLRPNAAG